MYDRTRDEGFGAEVKRRIMLGTYVLSAGYYDAYYLKAQQVRTLIARDYARAFEHVDVMAMPTCPTPAFRLGEKIDDPLQMYLADVFTVSANLTGLPAVSDEREDLALTDRQPERVGRGGVRLDGGLPPRAEGAPRPPDLRGSVRRARRATPSIASRSGAAPRDTAVARASPSRAAASPRPAPAASRASPSRNRA